MNQIRPCQIYCLSIAGLGCLLSTLTAKLTDPSKTLLSTSPGSFYHLWSEVTCNEEMPTFRQWSRLISKPTPEALIIALPAENTNHLLVKDTTATLRLRPPVLLSATSRAHDRLAQPFTPTTRLLQHHSRSPDAHRWRAVPSTQPLSPSWATSTANPHRFEPHCRSESWLKPEGKRRQQSFSHRREDSKSRER